VKLGRIQHRKPRGRSAEALILFAIGPYKFAIAANAVEEIRSTEGMRAFAHGFGKVQKVRNLLHRDGKNYFVVDATVHLRMLSSRATRLLLLRDRPVALAADSIDRMAEVAALHPLPRAFQGEERKWYRGFALIGEDLVPVLEPAAFLTATELAALQAALPQPAAVASAAG
jgi:chemotaxis signal transduction protein